LALSYTVLFWEHVILGQLLYIEAEADFHRLCN
jgi:hypothetical protein